MGICRWLADQRSRPFSLANFDSSTTLLRALAESLHGADFPALGIAPRRLASILPAGNRLPRDVRQRLYQYGSAREAIDPDDLGDVRIEDVREWVVDRYPTRGYPAVLVGSANGAAVHLAALLGIPWLPQTFLLPVRRALDPDDPRGDLAWGRRAAGPLLDANPDLKLHQMHDPNQDRLPIQRMAYFRVKALSLGPAYEQFLETVLSPDGTIVLLDCEQEWPTTRVDDRHVFQFGGVGDVGPTEYHEGSDRIAEFLDRQGSDRSRWDPPEPDDDTPEAEWGFDDALGRDVRRFAEQHDYSVRRLSFDHPDDLSPFVADFYRDRYAAAGIEPRRLVVDTFAQVEPWWTLRTGSVPFWLTFTTEDDARSLETYLDATDYDEIYVSLFSHGVESIGLVPIERWRSLAERARDRGTFLGVSPENYPVDYGTYVRYNSQFPETVSARHPIVSPPAFDAFEEFAADSRRDAVQWELVREASGGDCVER